MSLSTFCVDTEKVAAAIPRLKDKEIKRKIC